MVPKVKLYFVFFGVIYVVLNFIVKGSMFNESIDGFYYQLVSVSEAAELGSLSIIHSIRYYLVMPFYLFKDVYLLQGLFYCLYVLPVFLISGVSTNLRVLSLVVFLLPVFFSYRSVFVMISVYIVILHVYKVKQPVHVLFVAVIYSFLSTGAFIAVGGALLFFIKKIVPNNKKRIIMLSFVSVLFVVFSGSFVHKFLFFIDPVVYGSAASVTAEAIMRINISDLSSLFSNMFNRGILYESFYSDKARFSLLVIFFALSFILYLTNRNSVYFYILVFYSLGCLTEGLMAFSFILSVFLLFTDYILRQLFKFNRV